MEEIDKINKKANEVIGGLVKALEERGHTVETRQDNLAEYPSITKVDVVYINLSLLPERRASLSGELGRLSGKLRMRMKDCSAVSKDKSYPEPKIGFVNPKTIKRIEDNLLAATVKEEKQKNREQRKVAASLTLDNLARDLGLYGERGPYSARKYTLSVLSSTLVQIEAAATPEQAKKIVAILRGIQKDI